MIETLESWDQALFKLINGAHFEFGDILMPLISNKFVWIPLYALMLYGLIKYTPYPWWQTVLAIILLITISDQLASGFLKPTVARLRPCYETALDGMVHLLKGCGGKYGFASSHASNSFAIAFFVNHLLKDKFNYVKWLIAWAALIAYSRIYLGVHYFGDVLAGALIGWLAAFLVLNLLSKISDQRL